MAIYININNATTNHSDHKFVISLIIYSKTKCQEPYRFKNLMHVELTSLLEDWILF
jgi:hypothetical protein